MVIDDDAVDKAAKSLDVLANAVIARDETLERERETQIELLVEIQAKFGPLMLRFKRRIEEAAPTLIQEHDQHPGGLMKFGHSWGEGGVYLNGFNAYVSGASCVIHLGWDGKLTASGKHLFDGSDPDVHVDYQFNPTDPKAFIASILNSFKRMRDAAVDVLSKSEDNRTACLVAATEIRRIAVSSALGSATGGW